MLNWSRSWRCARSVLTLCVLGCSGGQTYDDGGDPLNGQNSVSPDGGDAEPPSEPTPQRANDASASDSDSGSAAAAETTDDAAASASGALDAGPSETSQAEDSALTRASFMDRYVGELCTYMDRCGDNSNLFLPNVEVCEALIGSSLNSNVIGAEPAVLFDPSEAKRCLDQLAVPQCLDTRITDCDDVFSGPLALGETCAKYDACQPALFCDINPATCGGICTDLQAEGAACERPEDCAQGLICTSEVCRVPLGSGDACPLGGDTTCDDGLFCPSFEDSPVCVPATERFSHAEGEECGLASRFCDRGLTCAQVGDLSVCQPLAGIGDACYAANPGQCPLGTFCEGRDSDGTPGICAERREPGSVCDTDTQCRGYCVDGQCVPHHADGEPCEGNESCLSQLCTDGACAPTGTCVPESE